MGHLHHCGFRWWVIDANFSLFFLFPDRHCEFWCALALMAFISVFPFQLLILFSSSPAPNTEAKSLYGLLKQLLQLYKAWYAKFFLFPITLSGSISVIKHQLIPSVSTSLSPVLYSVSFLNSIIICLAVGREEEEIYSLILLQLLWKIVVSQDESISYCNHWHYDIIANIILNVPLVQASQDFTTLSFFIPCYLGYPYFLILKIWSPNMIWHTSDYISNKK